MYVCMCVCIYSQGFLRFEFKYTSIVQIKVFIIDLMAENKKIFIVKYQTKNS